jgi:hypothetical protein
MQETLPENFVVFLRDDSRRAARRRPQAVEQPVATCASYEEAVRVRQEYRDSGRSCVIRCVGETGGGD